MKRVLFISILSALFIAACGQKSNLGLKAREAGKARQKTGTDVSTEGKVEGAFTSLKEADTRKLGNNDKATRNILLGDSSLQTNILCTGDFEFSAHETARIKVLGGGQILLRQDAQKAIPETAKDIGAKKVDAAKEIVNVLCVSSAMATTKLERMDNVTHETLALGQPQKLAAKLSATTEDAQDVIIACGEDAHLSMAREILTPAEGAASVQILIGMNTKLLLETKSESKDHKQYLLIDCGEKAQSSQKDESATVKTEDSQAPSEVKSEDSQTQEEAKVETDIPAPQDTSAE